MMHILALTLFFTISELIRIHEEQNVIQNRTIQLIFSKQSCLMSGTYQFRKFDWLKEISDFKEGSQSLTDIYLHRRSCTQVGIKFREPKPKEYGWKLVQFECKIAEIEKHEGIAIEKWRKHVFSLEDSIKLRISPVDSNKKQIFDNQHLIPPKEQQDFQKLVRKAEKMHKFISSILLKSELSSYKQIQDWCSVGSSSPALQIFIVLKNKAKVKGRQVGNVKIQRMIHKPAIFYLQTECLESKSWPNHPSNWELSQNTSYPALLEKLFVSSKQSSTQKQEQSICQSVKL